MTEREATYYRSRYRPLVLHLTTRDRESLSREDYEEMEADCLLAALRAVSSYDPNHSSGATMYSFVGHYIALEARARRRRRRHPRYDDISLDSPANPGDPDGSSLVDNLADDRPNDIDTDMEKARRMGLVMDIAEALPPGQRRAILGALDGKTVPEIASHAGISRAAVGEAYRDGVEAVRLELDRRECRAAAEAAYRRVME